MRNISGSRPKGSVLLRQRGDVPLRGRDGAAEVEMREMEGREGQKDGGVGEKGSADQQNRAVEWGYSKSSGLLDGLREMLQTRLHDKSCRSLTLSPFLVIAPSWPPNASGKSMRADRVYVRVKDGVSAYRVYWLPRVTMGGNLLGKSSSIPNHASNDGDPLRFPVFFYMGIHIYSAVSSPLSGVPGPWYAIISDAWFNSHFLRHNQAQAFHKLFQRYGPVVRVGPQKIVFCDLDSMRNVYNIQRFEKFPMYSNFKIEGVDQRFHICFVVYQDTNEGRRINYAATNVARMEPIIRKSTLEAIHIIAFSSFGYTIAGVRNWTLNVPSRLSVSIADFAKMTILSSICNTWVWRAICLVPHKRVALFTQSIPFLKQFVAAKVQEAQQQPKRGEEFESLPLAHRLLMHRHSSTNETFSSNVVTAEIIAHLCGESIYPENVAHIIFDLRGQSQPLHKLRVDIDAIISDLAVIPDLTLTAFIQEGLRVYTVIPSLLEHVVPATSNFELMGYSLPPGTVVGTKAWSMHKDPVVFPNPECFSPQRWLDGAESCRSLREEHLMPFGLGSRACVGKQLAHASFRIILAAIIRNFNISAGPTTTPATLANKQTNANVPKVAVLLSGFTSFCPSIAIGPMSSTATPNSMPTPVPSLLLPDIPFRRHRGWRYSSDSLEFHESGSLLDRVLRFWYPGTQPDIESVAQPADPYLQIRYGICRLLWQEASAGVHSYRCSAVFVIAGHHQWRDVAIGAAKETLALPLRKFDDDPSPELLHITAKMYHDLLRYHSQCARASFLSTARASVFSMAKPPALRVSTAVPRPPAMPSEAAAPIPHNPDTVKLLAIPGI
ncbi:cytochrome P450 [Mycena rebaudengoi]|nr:cytochrome P450 [Mycena rebaudengoi]